MVALCIPAKQLQNEPVGSIYVTLCKVYGKMELSQCADEQWLQDDTTWQQRRCLAPLVAGDETA